MCGASGVVGRGGEDGHSMRLLLATTLEVMDPAEIDWIKETRAAIALVHTLPCVRGTWIK